jgi:hypothetical protein
MDPNCERIIDFTGIIGLKVGITGSKEPVDYDISVHLPLTGSLY